jgi:pimeloyl-ACP methyl ester carboxylesterase
VRERKYLKVATLLCVLATINLVALSAGSCQTESLPEGDSIHLDSTSAANIYKVSDEVGPRVLSGLTSSASRNVIVVGFVGGFVKRDDATHPEVQFAAYLRDRYPAIHAEVFGNHHGQKALDQVVRLLDTDHDGSLTSLEKERATIILYGHSWGASETVMFARKLGEMGIPVVLTIQIDTIAKPGHRGFMVPPNVANAINFYQTGGPLHGRPEIVPADPERTKIIGNFRMTYEDRPINCDNYSWYARVLNKPHHEIENDLRVWDEAASLVDSDLSGTTSIVETPSPSSSPFFKYLRRGFQADITAIASPEVTNGQER